MLRKKLMEKLVSRGSGIAAIEANTHYESGVNLANQGMHDESVREFKRALQIDADFFKAYMGLGSVYQELGQLEKAIEVYLEVTRRYPDCVEAHTQLGLAYDGSGEFLKALRMHTKAIRLKPDDLELRKNLGLAYFNIGSYAEAIKAYKQALQIDPNDGTLHYYLGLVYLDLEDKDSANEELRLLKELGQSDVASLLLDEIDRQTWRVSKSKDDTNNPDRLRSAKLDYSGHAGGFSVIELLIVVSIISVVSGFALMQITRARQVMVRENAARQLDSYLEKARVDSLRRHATASAQMAQVTLINATFYSVTIDADGNGALDAPKVISLPADSGLQFNTPFPRTIYFNWRGRTVDAAGNVASPPFVTISNTYGSSRIDLTTAGQPTLQGPPTSSSVTNSTAPAPTFRSNMQIP
jgi:prepilin-type N-terminal cleavage/methylation domain-containing protein